MADGRVALVTGVSRPSGIGPAVARRLAADGWTLLLSGLRSYDSEQSYSDAGASPSDDGWIEADLLDPAAPAALVRAALDRYGRLDAVVANHAYSTHTPLGALDATEIDKHLQVNVRATLLLVEAFAAAYTGTDGRVVLFSSGQRLGPMPGELAYIASKAGVEVLVKNLSYLLADRMTVNALNPGPTDTGYAHGEVHARVARMFPGGTWGTPEDAARLVGWLCSADARWITGQVIDSKGGFDRFRS